MIQPASPFLSPARQWIYCLRAYSELVQRLPLLYMIVEEPGVVGIELHLPTGAFEVLWITPAGYDHLALSVSVNLDTASLVPPSVDLAYAATELDSDLQRAASHDCADQGSELVLALSQFRAAMIEPALAGPAGAVSRWPFRLGRD